MAEKDNDSPLTGKQLQGICDGLVDTKNYDKNQYVLCAYSQIENIIDRVSWRAGIDEFTCDPVFENVLMLSAIACIYGDKVANTYEILFLVERIIKLAFIDRLDWDLSELYDNTLWVFDRLNEDGVIEWTGWRHRDDSIDRDSVYVGVKITSFGIALLERRLSITIPDTALINENEHQEQSTENIEPANNAQETNSADNKSKAGKPAQASEPAENATEPANKAQETNKAPAPQQQQTHAGEIDQLVTLNQAAAFVNRSKRTLDNYVQKGKLPKPDEIGGNGKANYWRWKSIRPALQEHFRADLPEHFPGQPHV